MEREENNFSETVCQFTTFFIVMAIFVITTVFLVLVPAGPCGSGVASVTTTYGMVCGNIATSDGARSFLGIPYAQAPVGSLRWKAPQAWTSPYTKRLLQARTAVSYCPQKGYESNSEDCLYLNIYAPAQSGSALLPVLFFVHGGGFYSGGSSDPAIDGLTLATDLNSVVVTANYRLGPLGFLALEELKAENGTTGNYGLLDQQQALRWVKENIKVFGGNPKHVLLFGESAGATSVIAHLCSNSTSGLFQAAAAQSGSMAARNLSDALDKSYVFARSVGCEHNASILACLRALPSSTLITADSPSTINRTWMPVIDGAFLSSSFASVLKEGTFNQVPVIVGSAADEGSLFIEYNTSALSASEYPSAVVSLIPEIKSYLNRVLSYYPAVDGDNLGQLSQLYGDYWYTCPARRILGAASEHVNAHGYVFSGKPQCTGKYSSLGSFHGIETLYLFSHPEIYDCEFEDSDTKLAHYMKGYWYWHAASDLNNDLTDGRIAWTAFTNTKESYMSFSADGLEIMEGNNRTTFCDFWDQVVGWEN